jgi:exopolysaccharide biosynthesis polyprenyl glycosylphosphotransferase
LGELWSLDRVLTEQSVHRIIVAFGAHRERDLVRVLRTALRRNIAVYVVPRLHEIGLDGANRNVETIACTPLQRARPAAPNMRAWPAKRVFDVLVAGTVLLLLSPLLAILAIGVKLDSPGPILFRQQRVGQYGRTFELLKFRSLRVNSDSDVRWSVVGDDRQTRLGAWMRRFSVDELPQLWNVVRGDMSLIGPRPERPHFVEEFSDAVAGYEDRHRLPVGLTGWAQINGLRGDTSIDDRAKYDNHYIDHWSLLRDLTILVATVSAVLRDARRKPSA